MNLKTRKGVNPLIATVLLLAFVMSIAVLTGSFFPNVFKSSSDKALNETERLKSSTQYSIGFRKADYNSVQDTVNLSMINSGEKIDGNVTITLICESSGAMQKTISGIKKGGTAEIGFSSACKPRNIRASLNDFPVETETSSINTLNFGLWSQDSASEFESNAKDYNNVFFASIQLDQDMTSKFESSSFSGAMNNVTETGGALKLE